MVGATVINGLIHNRARQATSSKAGAMSSILLIAAYVFGARLERRLYEIAMLTERAGEPTLPLQYDRVFEKQPPSASSLCSCLWPML